MKTRSPGDELHQRVLATTLKCLARRWLSLASERKLLDAKIESLTSEYTSQLRSKFEVGPNTAAVLLSVAGDNPERPKSEASLAALCGVNPLPASPSKTVRHQLNQGGSRAADNAL